MSSAVNLLNGDRYALEGKVVTMDPSRTVLERGVIYIHDGLIKAVLPEGTDPPLDFESTPVIRTGGTIYPGLIELHNHLSYNILPLWMVPEQFTRREQWRSHKEKQKLVTGPMKILGSIPSYVKDIVRFVECKCLVSGVTSSQGLKLYGVGIDPYYKGLVRNVEAPQVANLPRALTRIADVEAKNLEKFYRRLDSSNSLLLHLCEGLDEKARKHFDALQFPDGSWAINEKLAGIHCAALTPEQFQVLGAHNGTMVWSPLSNLLLYGDTANIQAAREAGVLMAIGSDWSPSGSKNLLCELKVAHLVSEARGGVFSMQEIVAMATINAARIIKWDHALGSIERDKYADLLVVDDRKGDPYQRMLEARETSVKLVLVQGVPRYGQDRLMRKFETGAQTEALSIGSAKRQLNLHDPEVSSLLGDLELGDAISHLKEGLGKLSELARAQEDPHDPIAWLAASGKTYETPDQVLADMHAFMLASGSDALADVSADDFEGSIAFLELDNEALEGESLRPHLPHPDTGEVTGFPFPQPVAVDYAALLEDVHIELDGLTLMDDDRFFWLLAQQKNLPPDIKNELPGFYGRKAVLPDNAAPFRRLDGAVKPQFASTLLLSEFMQTGGYLSKEERQRIVEQALVLMEQIYVHMPLKRAMHAVDPVQRLRLLRYHLDQQGEAALSSEIAFHNELTSIFTSVRDLHTNYLLPGPYADMIAFLPFVIEQCYQDGKPKYLVSKVVGIREDIHFKEGVEVLYWNGIPIHRAVEQNAERQAGGNQAARHARGLDALTIRPLVRILPPVEEWVTLRYRDADGAVRDVEHKWLVFAPNIDSGGINPDEGVAAAAALGYDLQTDMIQQVKKIFYAAKAIQAERDISDGVIARAASKPAVDIPTSMPTVFRARKVSTSLGDFAYVRIFTFQVKDAAAFVEEFVRLVQQLPQNGLIIDVRGNGGGLIYAAECLLQVLTPQRVQPEGAQFINKPLTLEICRQNKPSPIWEGFDLEPWFDSIRQSVQTGAVYSRAVPITPQAVIDLFTQAYYGPKVLITDALCYSATDMFAAGFQDHKIGKVLGTSSNTGAGGANVWTHSLLSMMLRGESTPFKALPRGAGMRVAIRRTLRMGDLAGMPLEDLGVEPDLEHQMTERDLLEGNKDLIEAAGQVLSAMDRCNLAAEAAQIDAGSLKIEVTSLNIDWLEILHDRRLLRSMEIADGTQVVVVTVPPGMAVTALELRGYTAGKLVARHKTKV